MVCDEIAGGRDGFEQDCGRAVVGIPMGNDLPVQIGN